MAIDYVIVPIATVKGSTFIGSTPLEQSVWLKLLVHVGVEAKSFEEPGDGRIRNCRNWVDRRWQQTCQVTLQEVNMESALWRWEGNDLLITNWPEEAFLALAAKRKRERDKKAKWREKKKRGRTAI